VGTANLQTAVEKRIAWQAKTWRWKYPVSLVSFDSALDHFSIFLADAKQSCNSSINGQAARSFFAAKSPSHIAAGVSPLNPARTPYP
jgi:hypothetical protein